MKEIILTMINNKIQFHEIKNLRSIEKTGEKDQKSLKRIEELNQLKKKLKELSFEENSKLMVQSTIKISKI